MAKDVAQCEFIRRISPVDLVGRDAASDPQSALAHIVEILQKRLNGADFHK